LSYRLAKKFSRHLERFGTGIGEGVMATETAAHAAGIGALLPIAILFFFLSVLLPLWWQLRGLRSQALETVHK
jgi:TctA family transporter